MNQVCGKMGGNISGEEQNSRQQMKAVKLFFCEGVVEIFKGKWSESDRTATVVQQNATYLSDHGSVTTEYVVEDLCLSD